MSNDPRLTPLAASLPSTVPFVGPEVMERQRARPFSARLGANENGFGPAPSVIRAMQDAAGSVWCYGDSTNHDLRQALAAHHGIDPAHITVGEGIDGLLGVLVRLTVGTGDRVVTSRGGYPTFNYHVAGFGGTLDLVDYAQDLQDCEALLARAPGAKLVYLATPDNPMGAALPPAEVEAMVARVPNGTLLVLDEAYGEFAEARPQIAPDDPRVIRMGTFSKAYGLAGLRVGYAIGPRDLIAAFDRVRNHFGVNRMAQTAALAALDDQDWLTHIRQEVAASRRRIAQIGAGCGLTALPSQTNFVTLDCGADGALARRVVAELAARDVFIRMPGVAPLDRCVRISCGPAADMDLLADALPQAVAAARQQQPG